MTSATLASPSPPIRGLSAWHLFAAFAVDPINCLERFSRRHGDAIRIEGGWPWHPAGRTVLVLLGPKHNRDVLMATDRLRPTGIWPVRAPEGSAQYNLRRNYLTTYGDEHTRFSAAVAPHLERTRVAQHFAAVKRIALSETSRWPLGEAIDVYRLIRDLAQHYAFSLVFGEADLDRIRSFGERLAAYHAANWSRLAAVLRLDLPGLPYRRVMRQAEEVQGLMLDWIAHARACPHAARAEPNDVRASLSALPDACGGTLAPERTAAHLCGLALASYETTTTTLTWALVLLAQHPRVMAALVSELATLGPLEAVDNTDLEALPMLGAVLQETMRLITPVPILGFRTINDCEVAGFHLPAAATVLISPHLTHRLPEIYPKPNRFHPERWLDIRPSAYEYLPFSGGPRRCPGFHFAMANMRMAMAAILTRFRLTLADGSRLDRAYAAITVPKNGVPMRIARQDGRFDAGRITGSLLDLFEPARA